MERKNNLLIGLTCYLENSSLSFLALKLREFIRFVTIPGYENKYRALSNHVPNAK